MGAGAGFVSGLFGGDKGKKVAGKMKSILQSDKGKSDSSADTGSDSSKSDSGSTDSFGEGFKKGGKVKHTGLAKVHKGERVLTKKQAKKYAKKRGRK